MTHLFDLITHSGALTSLVIVAAIVLFIVEMFSPHTFGLVGVLGMMVISVLLYAYQVSGVGYWFGPLIAIVGLAFVMLDALGIHAHGFLLMPDAASIGIGMFYALGAGENAGFSSTAGIAATFCALYYAFKVLPLSTFWRESGSGNTLQLPERPVVSGVEPGTQCIAASDLRPCGMVKICERRYRARLIAGFARIGTKVVVSEVRNQEVLVTVEKQ